MTSQPARPDKCSAKGRVQITKTNNKAGIYAGQKSESKLSINEDEHVKMLGLRCLPLIELAIFTQHPMLYNVDEP